MMWAINQTVHFDNGKTAMADQLRLSPMAYPGNGNAHVWSVTCMENGSAANLVGAAAVAYFKRLDGNVVVVQCSISDNVVTAVFPTEVYAVPGVVTAVMNLSIPETLVMSIAAITFIVQQPMDGNPIDPSGEITLEVEGLIAEIESAIASIPDDYSDLWYVINENFPTVNLLPVTEQIVDEIGVESTYYDGTMTVTGTASASGGRNTRRVGPITLPAGTYKASMTGDSTGMDVFVENSSTNSILCRVASNAPGEFTLASETLVHIGLNLISGTEYDTTFTFQLTANGFKPSMKPSDRLIVPSNYVTPEQYGACGDGVTDDTAAIQAAVDSGLPVMFSPKTYIVSVDTNNAAAIPVTKNNTYIFLNGATVKLAANAFAGYGIFSIDQKSNVTITGGIIIGDKAGHTGDSGEWGHGVSLTKVSNVTLENLTISGCWGDGIYIGNDSTSTTHNDGIHIHNVLCDGNRRNGMSIIDGKNIFVSDSSFNNTSGTAPQSGVVIEPNDTDSVFTAMFDNVICENNAVRGFDVLDSRGLSDSTIRIRHLTTDGLRLRTFGENNRVLVSDVTNRWKIADNALIIQNKYMSSIISITNMFIDCAEKATPSIPVMFDGDYEHNIKIDGLTIANGEVTRIASWARSSNTEASHVNINNLKLFNLITPTSGDVILVPCANALTSMCSLTTGNVPPPVEITLPYTAQAYSNYKVTTATEDQTVTLANIVPGKKVYIQNASGVRIRVKASGIPLSNPTASDYVVLTTGKTAVIAYEDSAATGKCHAEID